MNDKRRKVLNQVWSMIETVKEEEETALCNLPDAIQFGDKGDRLQHGVDILDEVLELINEVVAN